MTLRERLGLGLVRRMLARLSLAARVQELEAELKAARESEHGARNAAQQAELQRARAAHRAEQMEREAVALRTRMEQAERDAEDLRKLDEQAQERARQAEQERDEVKRLLEAAQRELAAQQGAAHALSLRLEKAERERAVFVEAIDKVKEIVRATCGPAAARPSVWSERRKNGEPIAAVYDIGLVTDRAAALIEKGDPDPRQGRPGAGADLLDSDGQETFRKDRTSVSSIAVPPPPPAAPKPDTRWAAGHAPDFSPPAAPEPDPALTVADLRRADGPGPVDVAEALEDLRGLEGGLNSDCVIVEKGERFIVERPAARGNYKVSRPSGATIGFVAPTGKVRRVGNWETYEETAPAAPEVKAADHEPPAGASPLEIVVRRDIKPQNRTHRWRGRRCADCEALMAEAMSAACPGPRGAP